MVLNKALDENYIEEAVCLNNLIKKWRVVSWQKK